MPSDQNEEVAVDRTALAVAACRALETSRADALIDDPFAAAFVAAAGNPDDLPIAWPAGDVSPLVQPILLGSIYIGIRTRFIDDFLAEDSAGRQVVILGAGLDARAFRLPWQDGTTVFELDGPSTLLFKQHALETHAARSAADRRVVPIDIATDWVTPLVESGFSRSAPTTWIVEGLMPYLSTDAQTRVLDGIVKLSAPGSRAVIERSVPLPDTPDLEAKLEAFSASTGLSMVDLLARANPPDPAVILGTSGWRTAEHSVAELTARYGRRLSLDPSDAPPRTGAAEPAARGGFVTATLA